jgi:hypothetical protein
MPLLGRPFEGGLFLWRLNAAKEIEAETIHQLTFNHKTGLLPMRPKAWLWMAC